MAQIFSALPFLRGLMAFLGTTSRSMFEAMFVLTLIDAGTRVNALHAPGGSRHGVPALRRWRGLAPARCSARWRWRAGATSCGPAR